MSNKWVHQVASRTYPTAPESGVHSLARQAPSKYDAARAVDREFVYIESLEKPPRHPQGPPKAPPGPPKAPPGTPQGPPRPPPRHPLRPFGILPCGVIA